VKLVAVDIAVDADRADVDDVANADELTLARLVDAALAAGASDLHITPGRPPLVRVDGAVVALAGADVVDAYTSQRLLDDILPARARADVAAGRSVRFAVDVAGARLRCSVFHDIHGTAAVLRRILRPVPSLAALGMPPRVRDLCHLSSGLVVVAGPAGSGRSTTMAAMIDHINRERGVHVVVFEDPVEVVHAEKRALVHHRTASGFALIEALAGLAAEDVDVVVVGDVVDEAAWPHLFAQCDAGRLVIVQAAAPSATALLTRLCERPREQSTAHRAALAEHLRGVVCQSLWKKVGGGRLAVVDVVEFPPSLAMVVKSGDASALASREELVRHGACSDIDVDVRVADLVARGVVDAG
jgi:twitching motility protein PilT